MANENEEKPVYKVIAMVLIGLLAGTGGSLGYRTLDNPRPDPFTGTDARNMKRDILEQCKQHDQEIERRLGRTQSQVDVHNRGAEKWKLLIQENKNRMDFHLHNHP